jgi:hypothetical protein
MLTKCCDNDAQLHRVCYMGSQEYSKVYPHLYDKVRHETIASIKVTMV